VISRGCSGNRSQKPSLADGQSVSPGWLVLALVMKTTRIESSGQYQILPAPVTSYCHCSRTLPGAKAPHRQVQSFRAAAACAPAAPSLALIGRKPIWESKFNPLLIFNLMILLLLSGTKI